MIKQLSVLVPNNPGNLFNVVEILKENIKVNFVVGEGNKIGKSTEDILREKLGDDFIDFIDE